MRKIALLLAATLAPVFAHATLLPEPAGFRTDIHDIVPSLRLGISDDSNYYSEPAGGENDTLVLVVSPGLVVRVGDDEEYGQILASVTGGFVTEESDDNFVDYNFGLNGQSMLKANLAMSGGFSVRQGHDERGTGNTRGCRVDGGLPVCPAEPDVYRESSANGALALGMTDSRGRLVFSGDLARRNYTNNEPRTDFLDYDKTGLVAKFLWKVGGRTDATAEVNVSRYDYTAGNSADNTGVEYLLGVAWDVTGKTTGYAKAGIQEKDFKDNAREDLSDPSYRVGVNWSPSERNLFNLDLSQTYAESDIPGADAKKVDALSARFSHLVTDRVEPWVSVGQSTTTYEGAAREDESQTLSLGVDYKFRRWAVIGLSYKSTEDDSTVNTLDYERDIIALTANLTL